MEEIYYARSARVLTVIDDFYDLQLSSDYLSHLSLINTLKVYAVFGLDLELTQQGKNRELICEKAIEILKV